jgi:ketosteroid isomerase-like protein
MEALMRMIGGGAVGLLLGIVITLGAQTGNSTEVDRAHDEFMRAALERDPTGWANTVTDDVQLVPNSGELVNKTERMAEIKNGEALTSSQFPVSELAKGPEYRVRVYGDAALVSWTTAPRQGTTAPRQGGPGPMGSRFVRVFVKQGNSWRMAHQQATPIQ